jgi:peptidoglycan/xylan/chitin deacetylase (PgdA/CDA1 family)
MNLPIRALTACLSPAGRRARLSVLIFHRVLPTPDPLFPDEMHAQRFDAICQWLKAWFNPLPLDLAVQRWRKDELPARACAITFDDGYADNLQVATPILAKHGLSATFFIATGFLDGGIMWNDRVIESIRHCRLERLDLGALGSFALGSVAERRAAIDALIDRIKYLPVEERHELTLQIAASAAVQPARDLMMTTDEVREMRRAGMQIGAHTVTHPILARLDAARARDEMDQSRRFLQDALGERVGLFAYPNGKPGSDYLPEHAELARDLGFDAAVSTRWGAADRHSDAFQIPRFTPWDAGRSAFGLRLVRNLVQAPR